MNLFGARILYGNFTLASNQRRSDDSQLSISLTALPRSRRCRRLRRHCHSLRRERIRIRPPFFIASILSYTMYSDFFPFLVYFLFFNVRITPNNVYCSICVYTVHVHTYSAGTGSRIMSIISLFWSTSPRAVRARFRRCFDAAIEAVRARGRRWKRVEVEARHGKVFALPAKKRE